MERWEGGGGVNTSEEVGAGEDFIPRNIETMLRVLVSICKRLCLIATHNHVLPISDSPDVADSLSVESLCNLTAAFPL